MKSKPYVGVTGPVTLEEVRQVGQAFQDAGFNKNSKHTPMIGVLVSYKTLLGQPTQNRRYPAYGDVQTLLREASQFGIPMIHYNSREKDTLDDQLDSILTGSEGLCEGVQLNIAWPDRIKLAKVRKIHPDIPFVIQLSHGAMDGLSAEQIAQKLKEYESLANYTLIDPSGGKGKEFDLNHSLKIYEAIRSHVPKTMVGFAGGFRGDNVAQTTRTLVDLLGTSDFCIDAEGGLRDRVTDNYGDDTLNIGKVKHYLDQAATVLN